jgi:hypothetical protein
VLRAFYSTKNDVRSDTLSTFSSLILTQIYLEYKRILNLAESYITCMAYTPKVLFQKGSRGSSINIDYRLDDRALGIRFSTEANDISSSLCTQTGSGAHPASCPMSTVILSRKVNYGRGVTLATHPHLVPRSKMSMSYTSSPRKPSTACSGNAFLFHFDFTRLKENNLCIFLKF